MARKPKKDLKQELEEHQQNLKEALVKIATRRCEYLGIDVPKSIGTLTPAQILQQLEDSEKKATSKWNLNSIGLRFKRFWIDNAFPSFSPLSWKTLKAKKEKHELTTELVQMRGTTDSPPSYTPSQLHKLQDHHSKYAGLYVYSKNPHLHFWSRNPYETCTTQRLFNKMLKQVEQLQPVDVSETRQNKTTQDWQLPSITKSSIVSFFGRIPLLGACFKSNTSENSSTYTPEL